MKYSLLFGLVVATSLASRVASGESPAFRVVVHTTHPANSIDTELLAMLFLKSTQVWPDGSPVLPIDQSMVAPVRRTFTEAVFRQPMSAVQAYWESQVAGGGPKPPLVRSSDRAVLEYVAAHPGAIGYVASAIVLNGSTKELRITEPQ